MMQGILKKPKNMLRILFLLLMAGSLYANNLIISGVSLVNQNTSVNTIDIYFNVSWDNSFRDEINWDAAWIFFKVNNGPSWQTAKISTSVSDYTVPAGSTISPGEDSLGFFIHKSAQSAGSNNFTGIKVKWYYGVNGFADNDVIDINAYGIEMVYIPEGHYWLGDGTSEEACNFIAGNITTSPYLVSSENSITLGGTNILNLGHYDGGVGLSILDDFDYNTTQTLPAAFPKGYNAFYCMKYEVTQQQYRDFLNALTLRQQLYRASIDTSFGGVIDYIYVMSSSQTVLNGNSIRCENQVSGHQPLKFYCDLNDNGIFNEYNDGQTLACNFLAANDMLAYADWAGLRPFTEMEYEKAGRGNMFPVTDEYAWGTTFLVSMTGVINQGSPDESPTNGNANFGAGYTSPTRVGSFANGSSTREQSGSSYYGVMNLSDNLNEFCVWIGAPDSRAFTRLHGDGTLTSDGDANTSVWNIASFMLRGGDIGPPTPPFPSRKLSTRLFRTITLLNSYYYGGARLCR